MNLAKRILFAAPAFAVRHIRGVVLALRIVCGAAAFAAGAVGIITCGFWAWCGIVALLLLSEAAGQGARALLPLQRMLFPKKQVKTSAGLVDE